MTRVPEARRAEEAFVAALVPRFVEHGAADGHTRDEVVDGTRRVLRDALHDPQPGDVFLIVQGDAGAPVGFAYAVTESDFFTGEPYLHVSEIATVRSGDGVGALLMDAVEARRPRARLSLRHAQRRGRERRRAPHLRAHGYAIGRDRS
jgi:hypothetical protein